MGNHNSSARRKLVIQLTFLGLSLAVSSIGLAQSDSKKRFPRPNRKDFEPGDLLFPKEAGKIVPYNRVDFGENEVEWNRQRLRQISHLEQFPEDEYKTKLCKKLSAISYDEFISEYYNEPNPNLRTEYSLGPFAVGHVAIVDILSSGEVFVIEAMPQRSSTSIAHGYPRGGVDSLPYSEWLDARKGQYIWHGRFDGYSSQARATIILAAMSFVGRPYNIFNFKLDDASEFYCSKLVWLSVMKALNLSVDGDNDPDRFTPLSPKTVLYSKAVRRLSDPGPYWRK